MSKTTLSTHTARVDLPQDFWKVVTSEDGENEFLRMIIRSASNYDNRIDVYCQEQKVPTIATVKLMEKDSRSGTHLYIAIQEIEHAVLDEQTNLVFRIGKTEPTVLFKKLSPTEYVGLYSTEEFKEVSTEPEEKMIKKMQQALFDLFMSEDNADIRNKLDIASELRHWLVEFPEDDAGEEIE